MGIHVSCDGCYKTMKENEFVTITLSSNSTRFPLKHSFIFCFKCMKDNGRIYTSVENPNYIPPPEEKVSGDEVKPAS